MNIYTAKSLSKEPRDPYIDHEQGKYFQSEDLPSKPKRIVHLITYSNFLSSNDDHSLDRPFTVCSPDSKKKSFNPNDFHKPQPPPFNDFRSGGKKVVVKEGHQALSTVNPIKFDETDKGPQVKYEIKRVASRNKSSLDGATAQPYLNDSARLSKKMHSGKYTDSSSMRLSLSHVA